MLMKMPITWEAVEDIEKKNEMKKRFEKLTSIIWEEGKIVEEFLGCIKCFAG